MKPPFKADQVGSLLRPAELIEARAKAKRGEIDVEGLRAVEDRCIRAAIAKQESIGLQAVTDGEFRRDWWHVDFLAGFDGVEGYTAPLVVGFKDTEEQPPMIRVTGKVKADQADLRRLVQVHEVCREEHREADDSRAGDAAPAPGALGHQQGSVSRPRRILAGRGAGLPRRNPRPRRRGLHLPAARRHELRLPVRREIRRRPCPARRRPEEACLYLRGCDQFGRRKPPGGHGDHHAHLPRQLQEHLGGLRRLRAGGRGAVLGEPRRLLHGIRLGARRHLRAAALCAQGKESRAGPGDDQSSASWRTRTRSSAASTRRRNSCRSRTSACRRNAASRARTTATTSRRTTSGGSWRGSSRWRAKSGARPARGRTASRRISSPRQFWSIHSGSATEASSPCLRPRLRTRPGR